jgi:hypothetical protein
MDLEPYTQAALAEAAKDGRVRVFDWDKAADIITGKHLTEAAAYLANDSKSTWRPILADGRPAPTEFVWLASPWGVPTLDTGEEAGVPCWRWQEDTSWTGDTYWPASALAILHGGVSA